MWTPTHGTNQITDTQSSLKVDLEFSLCPQRYDNSVPSKSSPHILITKACYSLVTDTILITMDPAIRILQEIVVREWIDQEENFFYWLKYYHLKENNLKKKKLKTNKMSWKGKYSTKKERWKKDALQRQEIKPVKQDYAAAELLEENHP